MDRPSLTKWLYIGLSIKRWLILLLISVVIMGLGLSYLLRAFYLTYTFPDWTYYATLQFTPRVLRGFLFIGIASVIALFAGWKLNQSLARTLIGSDTKQDIVDLVYQRRTLDRGPKIVAIGGGTGLSNLLRGLKQYTGNLYR